MLSGRSRYRVKMTFEDKILLNTDQFNIQMNIWDLKIVTFKYRWLFKRADR